MPIYAIFVLDIQREEKNVQKAIKDAAKRNDMGSAKVVFELKVGFCLMVKWIGLTLFNSFMED